MKMVKVFKSLLSTILVLSMLLNIVAFGAAAENEELIASLSWTSDFEQGEWKNGEAAFSVSGFEPGSEAVRYFKIENAGELAFSYEMKMLASEIGEMASVLEVYYKKDISSNTAVEDMTKIGTLAEVLGGLTVAEGSIVPEGESVSTADTKETVVAVAFRMAENVPKEFMNKGTGEFSIQLNLTSFDEANKFKVKFKNINKYMYRVGNANNVALSSLFEAVDGPEIGNVKVDVRALEESSDASGTYTANASDWGLGTIRFSGTGPVEVTIDDDGYANAVSLKLEVVDATNVTAYSGLKNQASVLLNDITMSGNGTYYLSGASLYGNGFTFDVTNGAYSGTSNVSENYVILLKNAHLDNVEITGSVYTQYGATADKAYSRATVLSTGDNTIANSYISNCSAPVRVNGGSLELVNTTLKGGNLANLDIRNGQIILDNVTTINQVNGNDLAADGTVVVGLGVVVYYENVLDTTTIEVRNGITQYNCLSKSQADTHITDSKIKQFTSGMFGSSLSDVQYTDSTGDVWVNSGILSMTDEVGASNISEVSGYASASPTILGKNGFLRTKIPDASSIVESVLGYTSTGQYAIAPTAVFEYPSEAGKKNYIAKTDSSNKYCIYDNGVVQASFDVGDSVTFDTSILTATKHGQTLPCTVKFDGTDCTGQTVTFDESGSHTLEYKYTDGNNYAIDENGNVTTYEMTYTKTVHIRASAVAPTAKNAEFTFGNNGSKKVTIGTTTYVMPNVSATSSTVGSMTVDGETVYYPIVDAYTASGKTEVSTVNTTMLYPVFKNVVSITDYADGGTGAAVTYGASTTTKPSGFALGNCYEEVTSLPASSSALSVAEKLFRCYTSNSGSSEPTTKNSVLVFQSPGFNGARNAHYYFVRYLYTDNVGQTYNYFVCYDVPEITKVSTNPCVTGDTLVTLADGSQKRIDQVTFDDELIVWDFFEGKYTTAKSLYIVEHEKADVAKIKLFFEDGTILKVANAHSLYNSDLREYAYIDLTTVKDFVGHSFAKAVVSEDGSVTTQFVKLRNYEVEVEYDHCYAILTAKYNNCITESMISAPALTENWYEYFEIGEDMKYTEESIKEETEKYGLYQYEDFAEYLTYDEFIAFSCPYYKILVEKGFYMYDDIVDLIKTYGTGFGNGYTEKSENDESDGAGGNVTDGGDVDPGVAPLSDEEESEVIVIEPKTLTITLAGNSITAGNYAVTVSGEGVEVGSHGYVIKNAECDVVLAAGGTATTGYAKISVGEDVYYTNQIANGEEFTLTLKNAVGKAVSVESFWGNSANHDVAQDVLIESGKVIEYTYTVEITATNATEAEDGYTVTENESVFTLTANGSATPGYAKISVNGDDYYTEAIAKGESFTFTVNNGKGKTVAIETFYGEPTAENLLASGSEIGYVAEVTAENATLNEDGKYIVDADEATITVTASGTSEGYAKITVGEEVYYTKQIASGERFVMTLKNAKGKNFAIETIWAKSENDGVAQDVLIESGKVIEYTYTVEITAANATDGEGGYIVTENESVFTLKAFGTATMGYATIAVDGDVYYTQKIVPDGEFKVTVKNAKGKTVEITAFYGEFDAEEVLDEYILGNEAVIDCGTFSIKSVEGTVVVLSNTTKYASETVEIYVAVYDSQNRMIAVKQERSVSVGGKAEHTFDSKLVIPENGYAKVFVWSGTDALKPVFGVR